MNTSTLAWHYTTGHAFYSIAEDGYIAPKRTFTPPGERAITWFSLNPYFELSAQKAMKSESGLMPLGMNGTYEQGNGLIRFGLKPSDSRLTGWPNLGRKAGMSPSTITSLEIVGIEQGANPKQWMGTFKRLHLRDLVIEVAERDGDKFRWVRIASTGEGGKHDS